MNDDHVKKQFQAWSEGRLDKTRRLRIQQHLDDCQSCRAYFDKMAILLEKPDAALLPRIEPDPFLPTRIRALAEEASRAPVARKRRWLQWSFNGAMIAVAALIGIYVGKGVAIGNGTSGDEEIISAYSCIRKWSY